MEVLSDKLAAGVVADLLRRAGAVLKLVAKGSVVPVTSSNPMRVILLPDELASRILEPATELEPLLVTGLGNGKEAPHIQVHCWSLLLDPIE